MLRVAFSFHSIRAEEPVGFAMGNMTFHGNRGTVTSAGKVPDQSMMLILSIAEMLDRLHQVLSNPRAVGGSWQGVDSSFRMAFRRRHRSGNEISVTSSGNLIHLADPKSLKNDIEQSVNDFMQANDLSVIMNQAETSDFHHSWLRFRDFMPP